MSSLEKRVSDLEDEVGELKRSLKDLTQSLQGLLEWKYWILRAGKKAEHKSDENWREAKLQYERDYRDCYSPPPFRYKSDDENESSESDESGE